MSYGVDVLSATVPWSYEEAIAHRNELANARDEQLRSGSEPDLGEPSAQMRDLHRRLTTRFPCICDDPEGPWADGPLINDFGQHAATLGISFSRVHEVLPLPCP